MDPVFLVGKKNLKASLWKAVHNCAKSRAARTAFTGSALGRSARSKASKPSHWRLTFAVATGDAAADARGSGLDRRRLRKNGRTLR